MSHYITENRALIEAVKIAHKTFGIGYTFFSNDWVVKLEKGERTHFIHAYSFSVNSHASAAIAADKVATSELLRDEDVACVPHYILTTIFDTHPDAATIQKLIDVHTSLVLKPTSGGRGHLVQKVSTTEQALEYIDTHPMRSWSASPYIAIQKEMRVVVFNDSVRLAYEKYNPNMVNGLRMFNLNTGASVRRVEPTEAGITDLALRAAAAIGLKMGAVDIIFDDENTPAVLEVNSGFSLEHFALHSPENRKSVVDCYAQILGEMFEGEE